MLSSSARKKNLGQQKHEINYKVLLDGEDALLPARVA